jgi:hypothetical protein
MGFTMSGRRIVAVTSAAAALAAAAGLVRRYGVPARVRAVPGQVKTRVRTHVRKLRTRG